MNNGRFEMTVRELLLVSDPQIGLNRLCSRFSNLKIDYVSLKRFPTSRNELKSKASSSFNKSIGKRVSKFLTDKVAKEHDMLFYSCRVDNLDDVAFAQTRKKLRSKSFLLMDNKAVVCSFKLIFFILKYIFSFEIRMKVNLFLFMMQNLSNNK